MASPSGIQVRPVEPGDEYATAGGLAALAFGESASYRGADRSRFDQLPDGRVWYGAFDAQGRLIGTAVDLCHSQWWGGRRVPAADVSAVAVLPEARGTGAARAMLKALLEGAYERGAAVSALFPTASAVYRASGWATCGRLQTFDLPTALLPADRAPAGGSLTVRSGDPSGADPASMLELYTRLARLRDGLLTRDPDPAPPAGASGEQSAGWPAGIDGVTLVEDDGQLVGYATWSRGNGYRSEGLLEVPDLLAATPEAAREAVAVIAGWRSVAPTVRIRSLDFDPTSLLLPWEAATRSDARPWMHRPVDVARAVSSRGWPMSRRGKVSFHVHDPVAPWNDGAWTFDVADGEAQLLRTATHPVLRLHVTGFALLYSGVATPPMLVEAGLLHGPAEAISGMELLRPKSAAQLLDHF